jgi:hypothetical protein
VGIGCGGECIKQGERKLGRWEKEGEWMEGNKIRIDN